MKGKHDGLLQKSVPALACMKNFSHDGQSLNQDLNMGPGKCE
jgi:hypothetical protein